MSNAGTNGAGAQGAESKVLELVPTAAENATEGAQGGDSAPEKNVGVYTHKFKRPFTYEGKTYEEMTFNFERLTGRDMIAVETEMQMNNEYALAAEISQRAQAKIAARAAGVGSDVIEAMPLNDFNRITSAARDFLLDSGY